MFNVGILLLRVRLVTLFLPDFLLKGVEEFLIILVVLAALVVVKVGRIILAFVFFVGIGVHVMQFKLSFQSNIAIIKYIR